MTFLSNGHKITGEEINSKSKGLIFNDVLGIVIGYYCRK